MLLGAIAGLWRLQTERVDLPPHRRGVGIVFRNCVLLGRHWIIRQLGLIPVIFCIATTGFRLVLGVG